MYSDVRLQGGASAFAAPGSQAQRFTAAHLFSSFQVQEELFGEWQTVPYVAPVAVGGVVSSWVPAVVLLVCLGASCYDATVHA